MKARSTNSFQNKQTNQPTKQTTTTKQTQKTTTQLILSSNRKSAKLYTFSYSFFKYFLQCLRLGKHPLMPAALDRTSEFGNTLLGKGDLSSLRCVLGGVLSWASTEALGMRPVPSSGSSRAGEPCEPGQAGQRPSAHRGKADNAAGAAGSLPFRNSALPGSGRRKERKGTLCPGLKRQLLQGKSIL